jgi:hypothetical protein
LRFARVADYFLREESIHCRLLDPALDYLVEIRLLGPVLSWWLESRGWPALHASAVAVGGRAVAFVGPNGGGKTTLTAALLRSGFPLLTDDVLALEAGGEAGDGAILGRPGYPQMRLWPDQAERFLGSWEHLPLVHPSYAKRRVRVGDGGIGSFYPGALPVGRLYLLDRRPAGGDGGIRVEEIPPRDALIELVRHSFSPHLVEAAGMQPRRLERFTGLLAQARLGRLSYPAGFEHLDAVADAVLGDLAGHGIDPAGGGR